MTTSLDLMRLVQMSQELLLMAWHGVQPKRLGLLALDLLVAREAASRLAQAAADTGTQTRARHTLAFIERLEEQVRRLYAAHRAAPHGVLGLTPGFSPRRR